MTTVRYFCTIFVWLIEEIFSHVSTKFYCKILKTSKVMNFLWKISKFQINQAWKGKDRLLNSFLKLYGGSERADFYVMVVNADYYESKCPKCPLSALIQACSLCLNTRRAFLMDSCGKSFQIAFRARFSVLPHLPATVCGINISQAYFRFVRLVNLNKE